MSRAVEVDTALAEIWSEERKAWGYITAQRFSLARALGIKAEYRGLERFVAESTETLIEMAEAVVAEAKSIQARDCKTELERMAKYKRMFAAARAKAEPLEAEFAAAPWSRFFLVRAHGGHVHSSMQCSTCFPTTQFGWLPELSGLTEEDAVEAHGAILCTVCFPSAPVEWTGGISKATIAEREKRDLEKAARDEAKAAKAITAPDGSPLRGEWGSIKTLVSAERELVSALYTKIEWQARCSDHPNFESVTAKAEKQAALIAEAISHKTGVEVGVVRVEALTKAHKKYRRDYGVAA